jgi:hypothetical protein
MDTEIAELRVDVSNLRTEMQAIDKSVIKLQGSFDGGKELNEMLLKALIDGHKDFREEQRAKNDKMELRMDNATTSSNLRLDSLESKWDKVLGYFFGATAAGGGIGVLITKLLGHG